MNEHFEQVAAALARRMADPPAVRWQRDLKGVASGWCRLSRPEEILPAAQAVRDLEGRLSMMTAQLSEAAGQRGERELAYHFDLDGTTLTVSVDLPLEGARVPSLTPLFRNADWNEREFRELYRIEPEGHPDPRPLFVDPSLEPGVFERLIPYSTFSNGASGKALWARVLQQNSEAAS